MKVYLEKVPGQPADKLANCLPDRSQRALADGDTP